MRARALDHRVRKEARFLVRAARAALVLKRGLRGKAGDLETVTKRVETGLAERDMQTVRRGMPALDSLVDELIKRPPKSTTRDYVESIGAAILIALALRAFVIEAFKIPSSSMYPTLEIGDHIFVNKFIYGIRIPWTSTKFFELRDPKRGEVIVFMQPCTPDRDYIKRVVAVAGDTVEVRCSVVYVNGTAVPSNLVEGECSFLDYDDAAKKWKDQPTKCSRYRETVAGLDYYTFHEEERPIFEQQLANGSSDDLLSPLSKDFPSHNAPVSCAESTDPDARVAPNQKLGELVDTTKPGTKPGICEQHLAQRIPPGHVFVMGDNRGNSNDSRFWGSVPVENIKGKALFIWLSYSHWGPVDWSGIRWPRIGNFVH
ncbi:MAG: signal peptidase I [Kofleriaceae bacterium]